MSTHNVKNLQKSHKAFKSLVNNADRDDLARCLRMLSMHLAMYKNRYGEMAMDDYLELAGAEDLNQAMTGLFHDGLDEASAMLGLILQEKPAATQEAVQLPLYAVPPAGTLLN